jgi:hypothetical protein
MKVTVEGETARYIRNLKHQILISEEAKTKTEQLKRVIFVCWAQACKITNEASGGHDNDVLAKTPLIWFETLEEDLVLGFQLQRSNFQDSVDPQEKVACDVFEPGPTDDTPLHLATLFTLKKSEATWLGQPITDKTQLLPITNILHDIRTACLEIAETPEE